MRIPSELLEFDKDPNEPLYADVLYAQHKSISAAMMGEDPLSVYNDVRNRGAAVVMQEDKNSMIQAEFDALTTTLRDMLTQDPEGAAESFAVAEEAEQEIIEQAEDPLFLYKNIVEELSGDPNIPEEMVEWEAEQLMYNYLMSETFDNNWWGTVKDVAGLIVAPNLSFISESVTEGEGGWTGSAADLQKMAQAFHTLPLEERIETFYALVDEVKKNTPNSLKAMSTLSNIVTEEGYERIATDHFLDKLGVVGYAADAAFLGMGLARRMAHPIAILNKVKNEEAATGLARGALENKEVRDALSMTQTDAAAHLSPIRMGDELFEGMPAATREHAAKERGMIQEAVSGIEGQVLQEGMESLVDTALAEHRAQRAILANEAGLTVTNVRVLEHTPRGMKLQYDVVGPDTPPSVPTLSENAPKWQRDALQLAERTGKSWRQIAADVGKPKSTVSDFLRKNYYVRQQLQGPPAPAAKTKTITVDYTVDDINPVGFSKKQHILRTPILRWFASPAFRFQAEQEALVKVMQRGMFQTGKWRSMFEKEMNRVINLAKGEDRVLVGKALEQGNLESKVYDYNTLRGMGLSDQGTVQYYAARELMDQAWVLKSREIADMHISAGHHLFDATGRPTPVRLHETPEAARAAVQQADAMNVLVFDDTQQMGRMMNLRQTTDGSITTKLDDMINDGYVLMRPQTELGVYEHMGEGYKFLLARKTETKPITRDTPLLEYQTGYLPIFYGPPGGANYFGQVSKYGHVDGTTTEVGRSTKVYFANRTDADAWAAANNLRHFRDELGMTADEAAEALADPKSTKPYHIKHDREIRRHEFDTWYAGGPYSGHRSTERLKRGVGEDSPEFVDPFFAIQKYLDHIASHMPLAAYRIGLEDKWMKHAIATGAIKPNFRGGFAEAIDIVKAADTRSLKADVQRFLIDSHNHISFNNRVASLGEQHAQGWLVTFAEKMETKFPFFKDSRGHTFLHNIEQVHLPDQIRAVNFHTLLGLGSVAQFVIQASGASVSIALHPIHALKAIPYSMGFAALDNVTNAGHKAKIMARLETAWPGMAERYKAWQKTGFHESIISSSGDYRSALSPHPVGSQFMDQAVGKAANLVDKSAFAYKAGELVNRRISFAVAIEKHFARGGKLDDKGIKMAMNDANDFMLNMDRAVKTDFQKGWWGVPTQFLQVHTKFMETLLGNKISAVEKSRLLAMQMAMFGGLGIPFGTAIISRGLTEAGQEPGDLAPWQIELARGGMANLLLAEVFGFNNEIATRTAIPNGISETFNAMFIEYPGLWETLAGAGGSLPQRALEYGKAMQGMLHANAYSVAQMDSADLVAAGQAALEMVSSTRSAVAAYQMFTNDKIAADGRPLLFTSDFTVREKIARGAGFQLSEVADMRAEFRTKQHMEKRIREYTDKFFDYHTRRWNVQDGFSAADARKFETWFAIAMSEESEGVKERVRQAIASRFEEDDTTLGRVQNEHRQRILMDIRHHLDVLSRQYSKGEQ